MVKDDIDHTGKVSFFVFCVEQKSRLNSTTQPRTQTPPSPTNIFKPIKRQFTLRTYQQKYKLALTVYQRIDDQ